MKIRSHRIGGRAWLLAGLGLALMCGLLFASSSRANPGLDAFWGNSAGSKQTLGGLFGRYLRGVAVNSATGEIYVSDSEDNRIQRFGAGGTFGAGDFISAWGKNVDSLAPATGYEICTVAANCRDGAAGVLGGELSAPGGIALDQSSGNLYVIDTGNNRVQEFSSSGAFLRAFGWDVVSTGPADSSANEQQTVTVKAGGGTFTLTFAGQTTPALPYNSGAEAVRTALNALTSISGPGGSVAVTGGPGDATGTTPYVVTFGGALGGDDVAQMTISTTGLTLPAAAAAVTSAPGGAFEICAMSEICKAGSRGSAAGAFGQFESGLAPPNGNGSGLAVAPGDAPNAGDVLVADIGNNRVQEFTAAGQFVRAFGADIVSTGTDDSFAKEEQTLTVQASGGKFALSVNGATSGATGSGTLASGSSTVNGVSTTSGAFAVGQLVTGGSAIPPGTTIVEVGAGTLTLSAAVTDNGTKVLTGSNFAFDSSAAEIQSALNALPTVGGVGGSVTVSGGPGNATGSMPYSVRFEGSLAGDHVAMASTVSGLAGTASVAVVTPSESFEVCSGVAGDVCKAGVAGAGIGQFAAAKLTRVAEDKTGRIYTVELTPNYRVQRFTLPGNVPTPEGEFASAALHGSQDGVQTAKDDTTEVAVDDAGNVYVVKAFPPGTGTPPVVIEGALPQTSQPRVLKLDPGSGAVVAVMAANPGQYSFQGNNITTGFAGVGPLAVSADGTSLYAATGIFDSGSGVGSRVWRLREIAEPAASEVGATGVEASTATLGATIAPAAIPLASAYRFEYSADGLTWTRAPLTDVVIGNGSAGGVSTSCPLPAAATCHVSQNISGLVPNTTYQLRIVVYSLFDKGQAQTLAGPDFTTIPVPPVVTTGTARWSSPADTRPNLFMAGTINPGHDRTTYQFEYVDDATFEIDKETGSGFQHAIAAPAQAAEGGHGLTKVPVHAVRSADPSRIYDYRLVATNSAGTSAGASRSVAPPNDSDRFYELVTPGDSGGSGVLGDVYEVADNGERATFDAQGVGSPTSLPSFIGLFTSVRGAAGWEIRDLNPDGQHWSGVSEEAAADLGARLWTAATPAEAARSEGQLQLVSIDGARKTVASLIPSRLNGGGIFRLGGVATDLSRAFLGFSGSGAATLLETEELVARGHSNLYEVLGTNGSGASITAIVNRATGKAGAPIGGACGAELPGDPHAVSNSGSTVYFYAFPKTAPNVASCEGTRRLYKRVDGETTVEIGKSQCAPGVCKSEPELDGSDEYKGASADGQVVFFTSIRQLTDSDQDTTVDLYAYDSSPPEGEPTLVQVSAGEFVPGANPGDLPIHAIGREANVLGTLDNAEDGSRVYFVAEGALTGENTALHKKPTTGSKNLYVYERDEAYPGGRIAFLGGLATGEASVGDAREWGRGEVGGKQASALPVDGAATGDGHVLLLVSKAGLTSEDTDAAKDLYRYDDDAGTFVCLSCKGGAGTPMGAGNGNFEVRVKGRRYGPLSTYAQDTRVASADLSTIVFATKEKLSADDENATWDAYAWHEGQIALISFGTEQLGMPENHFRQVAISPDGRDIFFATAAALVGSDTNNSLDIYDARVGGGFPEEESATSCLDADTCQRPSTGGGSQVQTSPGSASFSGSGNPPAPTACPKGKVRRNGRCVKKRPGHGGKKKHGKRADKRRGDRR